jgi:hypothetical protein
MGGGLNLTPKGSQNKVVQNNHLYKGISQRDLASGLPKTCPIL